MRGRRMLIAVTAALAAGSLLLPSPAGATSLHAPVGTSDGAPSIALAISPSAFSPDGDGRADRAVIVITLEETVALALSVHGPDGAIVRSLWEGDPAGPGDVQVSWDGRTQGGATAVDGLYRFRAEITDPTGTTTDAEIAVVVDTRAPSFRWRGARPEPLRDIGPVAFAFRTRDRSEVITVSSTVSDAAGRRVRRLAPVHTTGGRVQIVWDGRDRGGRPVGPGLYHVAFRLVDDARNVREPRPRPFRDHRAVTTTVLRRVGGAGSRIALTFDDCNDAAAWRRILKLLQDADMTASFFCIGPRVTANPVLARLTVRRGHTIGSHGWDHTDLTTLPQDAIRDRLARDAATWWRIASVTPVPFLRPPYGEVNAAVRAAGGHEGYGYAVLWDVDPEDWGVREPSSIASEVLSAARRGSIVVLHIARRTASALPAIIDGLRSRGLRSVSLTELMAAGG